MASTSKKMITLKSSDGEIFEVDEAVALRSSTIKRMIKEDRVDGEIPIPSVNGKTLSKVLAYCRRLADVAADRENNSDVLKVWEAYFVNVDMDTILDVITTFALGFWHSAMASTSKKMIILMSSDLESFEVDEAVVVQSQTIKNMIEDNCVEGKISLPNVTGKTLSKVLEYCKKHAEKEDKSEELKVWDGDFINVDQGTLFDLMLAANFLDIKELLDLTCQTVADMMKGKTPEEIREIFHIKNDYTPEEEEEVRRENAWAFEQ
ncbi:hypothetical protein GQ457_16G025590 [Hibiscus cannabinus]